MFPLVLAPFSLQQDWVISNAWPNSRAKLLRIIEDFGSQVETMQPTVLLFLKFIIVLLCQICHEVMTLIPHIQMNVFGRIFNIYIYIAYIYNT